MGKYKDQGLEVEREQKGKGKIWGLKFGIQLVRCDGNGNYLLKIRKQDMYEENM